MPETAWIRCVSAKFGRTRVGSISTSRPISCRRLSIWRAVLRSASDPARRGPIDATSSISCNAPTFPPPSRLGSPMPGPVNQGVSAVASPAAGVEFDRNRLSQGELIAAIGGIVLFIAMLMDWYGAKVKTSLGSFGGGLAGPNAWQSFSFIDILLFITILIVVGVAAL